MKKIKSTPIARKMAAKLGIDISLVPGSGLDGRILMSDIQNFQKSGSTVAHNSFAPQPVANNEMINVSAKPVISAHSEPVSPIRKVIAKTMKNSWNNVAYTNLVHKIDMTNLWNLRSRVKDVVLKAENVKITFLPYIAKAVAIALRDYPIFLAKYNEAQQTLDYPGSINLGFAVDTEAGLMVPVVNNADNTSIVSIASEINRLAKAARERTIKPSEMKGAGFTITNYGSVGSLYGVPVINYPELAIAGVGAIEDQPVVKNGQIVPGKVMYLTVAADHRWIDGATIGRFASRVKELLENPEVLGVY
ncbi:2-oxo acid dehydrogenase subunit E2 [Mycoplasmopsis lipofaciens]|uniref:2-oxo acid dehydrogenase subunit E2 n=1 Tax=Mycoplasmopsis lipofaciens TaxID=114884 RepID=UPI000482CB92|nr:2-oxo acid dehydrogenase subunit E2 [Mycoplasmopsis lipofaciens]